MKNILFPLFALLLLVSCENETASTTEKELSPQEKLDLTNTELLTDIELFMYSEEVEKQLINQESLEISKKYSVKLLEAAQKHIDKFPKSEYRREMIRKGSRAAQGLNQDFEAIRMLEIIIAENTEDTTIIEEMNVKAFLYDKMDKNEKAKAAYEEIIAKFPNHPSSANHKERLKTIHMTTEEMMEYFETKNAK